MNYPAKNCFISSSDLHGFSPSSLSLHFTISTKILWPLVCIPYCPYAIKLVWSTQWNIDWNNLASFSWLLLIFQNLWWSLLPVKPSSSEVHSWCWISVLYLSKYLSSFDPHFSKLNLILPNEGSIFDYRVAGSKGLNIPTAIFRPWSAPNS